MRIEHIGIQVENPAAMADWYIANLGFSCRRSADAPVPVRFIADDSGRVMLEIYRNPSVQVPDYSAADPLTLHVAFACGDIPGTMARLIAAGATVFSAPQKAGNGDELAILRDPWGLPIQLAHRATPLVD